MKTSVFCRIPFFTQQLIHPGIVPAALVCDVKALVRSTGLGRRDAAKGARLAARPPSLVGRHPVKACKSGAIWARVRQ